MKSLKILAIMMLSLVGIYSCEGPLEEEIFSQLAPSTLLTSEEGIDALLNSSYANADLSNAAASWSIPYLGGMPTGDLWGAGGSIESLWVQLQDFTWGADHSQMYAHWTSHYDAIRDANIVLDNLDNPDFSSDFVTLKTAEVHFIRGWCYSQLYNLFGPVPVYLSSLDDPLQARVSDAEMRTLIESELTAAIDDLPVEAEFGRATKGAAMGVLCKYYLNTRQWQNAADMAQDVIDLGVYDLESTYADVFSMANEGNSEMVWALTKHPNAGVNAQNALTYPPNYPRPYPNNGVFAARTYLFDDFVNSFDPVDTRTELIVTKWAPAGGDTIYGLGMDQSFPGKWDWDPNSSGWMAGNDIPVVRYADILLSRAEALNEVSGPSQEAIDLINDVRERAGVTPLLLGDYDQSTLRDAILQERKWEFWYEGKNREDLLRHDRFISEAQARGKNAQAHHVLYPLPQTELDANELLEQNPGY